MSALRRILTTALGALALMLTLASPSVAQGAAVAPGDLFTGSGSLADAIRGTHSRPAPVTRSGSVGDRVQSYRQALRPGAPAGGYGQAQLSQRAAALAASPASPARRTLWQAVKWGAVRAAPAAGIAALADSPVVPIGDVIGLGMIAASIATEVVAHMQGSRAQAVPQTTERDNTQQAGMRVQLQEQRAGGRTVHHASLTLNAPHDTGVTIAQVVAALQAMRANPAIGRRERGDADRALARAARWTEQRAPAGIAIGGWSKSFYFDPKRPNRTMRFDVENLRGHNLRQ